jgi:hypothetical protein
MTATLADHPPTGARKQESPPGWLLLPALLIAVALAVFAHGCHTGDHDDELSVRTEAPRTSQERP